MRHAGHGEAWAQAPAGPAQPDPATQASALAAAQQPYSAPAHDALVRQVRTGASSPGEAIRIADGWLTQAPPLSAGERSRLLSDRLVWLARGYPADAALQSQAAVPLVQLQDYALYTQIALARQARQARRGDAQGAAVLELLRRNPQDWQARVQEVVWLSDTGQPARAQAARQRLRSQLATPTAEQRVGLLELEGLQAEAEHRPLQARGVWAAEAQARDG